MIYQKRYISIEKKHTDVANKNNDDKQYSEIEPFSDTNST